MDATQPQFLVMAGPNGAGKSTCARVFVPPSMAYINADEIAKDLAREVTPEVNVQAARVALDQMDLAESRRESFAVETTLASKTLASRAIRLRREGHLFHLVYIWTPDADYSIGRVARRVLLGDTTSPKRSSVAAGWPGSRTSFRSTVQSPTPGELSII